MSANEPPQPTPSRWLLRRADQAAVAGLVLFALAAMAAYWVAQGGLQGRLIEIDRADAITAEFKVDINTADWPELIALPEVGEALARRIVEYRQQQGPFASIEDLRQVRGIGPRTMERLRPYLLVVEASPRDEN